MLKPKQFPSIEVNLWENWLRYQARSKKATKSCLQLPKTLLRALPFMRNLFQSAKPLPFLVVTAKSNVRFLCLCLSVVLVQLSLAFVAVAAANEVVPPAWSKDRAAGMESARLRNFRLAEKYLQSALGRAKLLGRSNSCYATSLNDLAEVYAAQRKWAQARDLFWQALDIAEAKVGKDSAELIKPLNNVVRVSCAAGNCYDTVPQLKRLLAIRKKAYGEFSKGLSINLLLLGEAYEKKGKLVEAKAYFEQAVETETRVSGKNSELTRSLAKNICRVGEKLNPPEIRHQAFDLLNE